MLNKSKLNAIEFRTLVIERKAGLEPDEQKALVRSAAASKAKEVVMFDESVVQINTEMVEDIPTLINIFAETDGLSDRERFQTLQLVTKALVNGIVLVGANESGSDAGSEA
jgi:hypothetical protein